MKILIPQGIGDSIWALTKVQDLARRHKADVIDIVTNTNNIDPRENRAMEFILGFDFVNSVGVKKVNIMQPPWTSVTDDDGCFRYIEDGPYSVPGIDYTLMPNRPMEHGVRLEDWLPMYKTNWNVMEHFQFTSSALKRSQITKDAFGDFCIFFLGSKTGNTTDGHNRGEIWRPEDWFALGDYIQHNLGLHIIVVGADYDKSYFDEKFAGRCSWLNLIGSTSINELFAIVAMSRFVVSYQSGVGIVAEYLGIPTAIFWRQKGDSISSTFYASFDEKMNGAWSPPSMIESHKHMALYYGRHDVAYVCNEIVKRGW
jgi:hypothetical protein